MNLQTIKTYRCALNDRDFCFRAELFNKAIWGDMGEDSAAISLSVKNELWHVSYIRTQSGEPYPLAETVCNLVDTYEKDLNDEQVYDYLSMHRLLQDFEYSVTSYLS